MSYEGTIAAAALLSIASYQLGKWAERRRQQKKAASIQRINEKYRPAADRYY